MTRTRCGPYIAIDGAAVRYHRVFTAGLTVTALAQRCGVTQPYISMIENGKQLRIGPAVFKKLREALAIEDMNVLLAQPHGEAEPVPA